LTPGAYFEQSWLRTARWCSYTKYESSGPCSFRQEDFRKLHLETFFVTPWPTYATNWNNLNNFSRGPPRDHSCEVWSKSNEQFQRRRCLSKKVSTLWAKQYVWFRWHASKKVGRVGRHFFPFVYWCCVRGDIMTYFNG